jgi:protein-L-isoaspartate(D-aspartate) O-methyltransferase
MVDDVRQQVAAGAMQGVTRLDPAVAKAMTETPRHRFVPEAIQSEAYRNRALPLGYESTISQPLVVAVMTDLLDVAPGQKVLEVGTGSGYQAALLDRLGAQVFTVDIVPELARDAARRLAGLGHADVQVRTGDGYKGWPEQAPFDRIMVTAGATHVPAPLLKQLAPGGRMLIPMGRTDDQQRLTLITKDAAGRLRTQRLARVVFIPLDERARADTR